MMVDIFPSWLDTTLTVIYVLTIISIIIVVISENRNPVKTISWILVLVFLPIIGIFIYLFFGQEFTRSRMISKKGLRKLRWIGEVDCLSEKEMPHKTRTMYALIKGVGGSPLYTGNRLTLFTDGISKFNALFAEIEKATTFVHLQYYIFENDDLGRELKALLIKKAQQGVEIRLIYDDVGCWRVKKRFFKEMEDAGIEVRPFLKVSFRFLGNKINYRNHRKIVVVDGRIGFIGGMNVAERYRHGSELGPWRDTHMMIEGIAVHGLQSSFAIDWNFTKRSILSDARYYPLEDAFKGKATLQLLPGGPFGPWREISLALFKAINLAKRYIYIQTPYFLPTDSIMYALRCAALGKVDVRIMVPQRFDSKLMQWGGHAYITTMLNAGVKIYFYQEGFLHAKTMVIDDQVATVGSSNLDFRSFEHNFEINSFVYDEDFAIEMKRIFLSDIQKCKRITWIEWRRRPKAKRALESLVRLFSPLL